VLRRNTILSLLSVAGLVGCGGDTETVTVTAPTGGEAAVESEDLVTGELRETLMTRDEYEQDGDPVREELAITVHQVDFGASAGDNDAYLLQKGNEWVRAQVTVEQRGDTTASPNPTAFTVIDDDNQEYTAEGGAVFTPALAPSGTSTLAPGDKRKGYIAFQVPKGTTIVALRFTDPGFGPAPDIAEWSIR